MTDALGEAVSMPLLTAAAGGVVARAPLVMAPPQACAQKLRPGEVKRCMAARDPLIAYQIACAKCGYRAAFTEREAGFLEEQILPGRPFPRRLVGISRPPRCYQCRHLIDVREGELVAVGPPAVS